MVNWKLRERFAAAVAASSLIFFAFFVRELSRADPFAGPDVESSATQRAGAGKKERDTAFGSGTEHEAIRRVRLRMPRRDPFRGRYLNGDAPWALIFRVESEARWDLLNILTAQGIDAAWAQALRWSEGNKGSEREAVERLAGIRALPWLAHESGDPLRLQEAHGRLMSLLKERDRSIQYEALAALYGVRTCCACRNEQSLMAHINLNGYDRSFRATMDQPDWSPCKAHQDWMEFACDKTGVFGRGILEGAAPSLELTQYLQEVISEPFRGDRDGAELDYLAVLILSDYDQETAASALRLKLDDSNFLGLDPDRLVDLEDFVSKVGDSMRRGFGPDSQVYQTFSEITRSSTNPRVRLVSFGTVFHGLDAFAPGKENFLSENLRFAQENWGKDRVGAISLATRIVREIGNLDMGVGPLKHDSIEVVQEFIETTAAPLYREVVSVLLSMPGDEVPSSLESYVESVAMETLVPPEESTTYRSFAGEMPVQRRFSPEAWDFYQFLEILDQFPDSPRVGKIQEIIARKRLEDR